MARALRIGLLIVAAGLLAGCDKCGDWIKPNIPGACAGKN